MSPQGVRRRFVSEVSIEPRRWVTGVIESVNFGGRFVGSLMPAALAVRPPGKGASDG